MKQLKSITVLSLVYSMLAMSGLPIAAMADDDTTTSTTKTYHYQTKQTDENGDDYTTSTFKGEGESQMNTADYLAMATMLAMGVAASSLAKATPLTTDIMLAAGSGVAYIGAEIYTMIAYDNIDVDQQIDVKMSESGVVDHEQLKALEKQKQSYLNIEKAAKAKAMIQMAATAGFGVAAGVATFKALSAKNILGACMTAGKTAVANMVAMCTNPLSALVADACAVCSAEVATIEATVPKIIATEESLQPSCTQTKELTALYETLGTAAGMAATPDACGRLVASGPPLGACAAAVQKSVADLVCASHLNDINFVVETPARERDTNFDAFENNPILRDAIFETNPDLERTLVGEISPNMKQLFKKSSVLGIRPRVKIDEASLDHYVSIRDFNRSLNGEVASISVDDYQTLRKSFVAHRGAGNDFEIGAILSAALSTGVDLLIPQARAEKAASGVGVLFAVGGLIYGLVRSEKTIMDKFMSTPGHRALVWGGIAGMATATAILSNKIAQKMGQNARQIDQMINAMRRLEDSGSISTLGGTGGETQQTISQVIVRPTEDLAVDPTGKETLPCVGGGKPPCKSISGNLDKTAGFVELKGNSLGTLSTLTGNVADGVQGQSTLTAGTLQQAQDLANQKEAIGKKNKRLMDELNKLRLKSKLKPIDYDKETERLARAFRNAARKQLKTNPSGARNLLASIAPNASLNSLGEELKKEEPNAEEGISGENTAVAALQGNAKPEDAGFSFDFGDDNGNTVVDAGPGEAALPDVIEGETGNDIIDKPNVPIWTIISVRYMKSGFPRLLELKE